MSERIGMELRFLLRFWALDERTREGVSRSPETLPKNEGVTLPPEELNLATIGAHQSRADRLIEEGTDHTRLEAEPIIEDENRAPI